MKMPSFLSAFFVRWYWLFLLRFDYLLHFLLLSFHFFFQEILLFHWHFHVGRWLRRRFFFFIFLLFRLISFRCKHFSFSFFSRLKFSSSADAFRWYFSSFIRLFSADYFWLFFFWFFDVFHFDFVDSWLLIFHLFSLIDAVAVWPMTFHWLFLCVSIIWLFSMIISKADDTDILSSSASLLISSSLRMPAIFWCLIFVGFLRFLFSFVWKIISVIIIIIIVELMQTLSFHFFHHFSYFAVKYFHFYYFFSPFL